MWIRKFINSTCVFSGLLDKRFSHVSWFIINFFKIINLKQGISSLTDDKNVKFMFAKNNFKLDKLRSDLTGNCVLITSLERKSKFEKNREVSIINGFNDKKIVIKPEKCENFQSFHFSFRLQKGFRINNPQCNTINK